MNISVIMQELKRFNFEFDTNVIGIKQKGSYLVFKVEEEKKKKEEIKKQEKEDDIVDIKEKIIPLNER